MPCLKIYILNPDTSVLHKGENSNEMALNSQIISDMTEIMNGATVKRMNPIQLASEDEVVYVGMPLKYNEKISGVVLLFTPMTELNKVSQEVMSTMIAIVIISLLLS